MYNTGGGGALAERVGSSRRLTENRVVSQMVSLIKVCRLNCQKQLNLDKVDDTP